MADGRTVAEIERDLSQARERLAANITQLITQTHPKVVAHRTIEDGKRQLRLGIADGKRKVRETYDWAKAEVKAQFRDEPGWNARSLAFAGAVIAAVAVVVVIKAKRA